MSKLCKSGKKEERRGVERPARGRKERDVEAGRGGPLEWPSEPLPGQFIDVIAEHG